MARIPPLPGLAGGAGCHPLARLGRKLADRRTLTLPLADEAAIGEMADIR